MKQFDELIAVADKLLSREGCPWDLEQTFSTLQPYLLEEAHEVIEAVDLQEDSKIIEELGDLLYILIFYSKLAEKEGRFLLTDILQVITEKMIRRHPHVFGEVKAETMDAIRDNWEKIKSKEKEGSTRKSIFDGIPPTLPLLARAQKIVFRMDRYEPLQQESQKISFSEQQLGSALWELVVVAQRSDLDAESALRKTLLEKEAAFRKQEVPS